MQMGHGKADINAGYFRPTMTVMDLSAMPDDTPLLEEAAPAAARWSSRRTFTEVLLAAQFESLTGKQFPATVWDEVLADEP